MKDNKRARPRLKIKTEPIDKLIEVLGIIGIALLVGLPIYYYSKLPDSIPIHFNANGPDGYGGKEFIWLFPALGIVLYTGMTILNRYPHLFNYPQKITKENAESMYKNATRMMRILNTTISLGFAYSTYFVIQSAIGHQKGLGNFMLIFNIIIFSILGFFLYKSIQKK